MKWNEIETIIPRANKWYLVKVAKNARVYYSTAPWIPLTWTGVSWFDGNQYYPDLTKFDGWVEIV